jgi:hypothetical protein
MMIHDVFERAVGLCVAPAQAELAAAVGALMVPVTYSSTKARGGRVLWCRCT